MELQEENKEYISSKNHSVLLVGIERLAVLCMFMERHKENHKDYDGWRDGYPPAISEIGS